MFLCSIIVLVSLKCHVFIKIQKQTHVETVKVHYVTFLWVCKQRDRAAGANMTLDLLTVKPCLHLYLSKYKLNN